jgi:hypothetical protein
MNAHLAHETAAGAALEDLLVATAVGLVALGALVALGVAHRRGWTRSLNRLGAFSERVSGLPAWAALPSAIAAVALVTAVFGFYWDVATHIDNGRDPGPFANPSHFLIIGGLAGCALAGYVAILLGRDPHPSAIRLREHWHVPIGGVLLLLCGGVAVAGFPLDDVWHRLFGQDVTLWSPTHVQMVGGASLSTLALWVLVVEGRRAAAADRQGLLRWGEMVVAGSFLIGLSALQAEFDYSVPQFRLLYHPVLLMASAGAALVAARIRLGKGAALVAVLFFVVVRAAVSLTVGPVLDHTSLHFPLYLVEAIAVEIVALRVSTERQFSFGLVAGAAIGTFGLAAEWAWSHAWMTMSWPASLGVEAILLGFAAAVAGACLGASIGRALSEPTIPRQRISTGAAVAMGAGILFVLAYPFPTTGGNAGSATIEAQPVAGRDGWARLQVDLEPPSLADDSEWFAATSWQGGGSVVGELEPQGEGRYISMPVPVTGEWKTLLRLHDGRELNAVPVYLPEDPVIPAEGTPVPTAPERREVVSDKKLLLREAKPVSFALTAAASMVLALLALAWVVALGLGLARLEDPARRLPWPTRDRMSGAREPLHT